MYRYIYIIFLNITILLLCFSFKNKQPNNPNGVKKVNFQRKNFVLLQIYKNENQTLLNFKTKDTLNHEDIKQILELLNKGVKEYNSLLKKTGEKNLNFYILSIEKYYIQLIPYRNEKNEKEVWVNCFCTLYDNWKKDIITIEDGGSCNFNVMINLTQKKYYNFDVNDIE